MGLNQLGRARRKRGKPLFLLGDTNGQAKLVG